MAPLRVICLHGKAQNAVIFRTRLGQLPRKCRQFAEFSIIESNHDLPLKPGDEVRTKSWFFMNDRKSLDLSLRMLATEWLSRGPFDGILGFSQGATMAAIAASHDERFPGLKFVVCIGGPINNDFIGEIPPFISSLHMAGENDCIVPLKSSQALAAKFTNPTFYKHVQGHCIPMYAEATSVLVEFLRARSHDSATTAITPAPVYPPPVPPPLSLELEATCASKDIAEAQGDELDVLGAIYPAEVTVLRDPRSGYGMPGYTASVCVVLCISDQIASSKLPVRWKGNISLKFDMPANYPESGVPIITVQTLGNHLSLLDFPQAARRALTTRVRTVAEACVTQGAQPCVLACVQEALDWLTDVAEGNVSFRGGGCSGKTTEGSGITTDAEAGLEEEQRPSKGNSRRVDEEQLQSSSVPAWWQRDRVIDPLSEIEEAEESERIREATLEAAQLAAQVIALSSGYENISISNCDNVANVNNSSSSDVLFTVSSDRNRGSRGGLWTYTVGLVGKPSAGKSTFFNAATRAALSRDGRRLAEVAAHPFTTIEPNVGPGWAISPTPDFTTRSTLPAGSPGSAVSHFPAAPYGRDSRSNLRLLPVVVKDVAGLVPGAYKGRGKGNKFLGDLCDADVLVHVVDATGRSDRDGNISTPDAVLDTQAPSNNDKNNASSPSEDAQWIREELHRWIHGNVLAKWGKVHRAGKGQTHKSDGKMTSSLLAAIFSGYQGHHSCLDRAGKRAKLDLDLAHTWGPFDLHRFVSHYLFVRFPICLALNKIDLFSAENCFSLLSEYVRESRMRGEAAVPVCASAECTLMLHRAQRAQAVESARKNIDAEGDTTGVIISSKDNKQKQPLVKDNQYQKALDIVDRFGSTGVLEALGAAMKLNPPVLCYPVSDLESEAPISWSSGQQLKSQDDDAAACTSSNSFAASPRLRDVLLLRPGSTVGDAHAALARGALSHAVLSGEFVRAEARGIDPSSRVRQVGKDETIDASCCVLRIQTNRKSVLKRLNTG